MHLSEFALRDFINIEPYMADTGVVVLDDVLPRTNSRQLAIARPSRGRATCTRSSRSCAGGGLIWSCCLSTLHLPAPRWSSASITPPQFSGTRTRRKEPYLLRPDPQTPPQEYLDRSIAVEPDIILESPVWERLVAIREAGASAGLSPLWTELRSHLVHLTIIGGSGQFDAEPSRDKHIAPSGQRNLLLCLGEDSKIAKVVQRGAGSS